jgi:hypothetical protein
MCALDNGRSPARKFWATASRPKDEEGEADAKIYETSDDACRLETRQALSDLAEFGGWLQAWIADQAAVDTEPALPEPSTENAQQMELL